MHKIDFDKTLQALIHNESEFSLTSYKGFFLIQKQYDPYNNRYFEVKRTELHKLTYNKLFVALLNAPKRKVF